MEKILHHCHLGWLKPFKKETNLKVRSKNQTNPLQALQVYKTPRKMRSQAAVSDK